MPPNLICIATVPDCSDEKSLKSVNIKQRYSKNISGTFSGTVYFHILMTKSYGSVFYWYCSCILPLFQCLWNIVFFLLDDPDDTSQLQDSNVSTADVVLYGLNTIVPLMTAELLKVILYIQFAVNREDWSMARRRRAMVMWVNLNQTFSGDLQSSLVPWRPPKENLWGVLVQDCFYRPEGYWHQRANGRHGTPPPR